MNDHEITALLDRAGSELLPDVADLVARGSARGRTRLRRRRAGAAMVAAVVVGIVGVGVAAALGQGDDARTTGVDVAGSGSTSSLPTTAPTPEASAQPAAPDADLALDLEATRTRIATLLPAGDVGPVLDDPPFSSGSTARRQVLNFHYDGTLTTFIIEPARSIAACGTAQGTSCSVVDGIETEIYGPEEHDRVTAQSVAVWRHGYKVTVMSYNAPDGKDVAPVTPAPPISIATLTDIAMSDAWYA